MRRKSLGILLSALVVLGLLLGSLGCGSSEPTTSVLKIGCLCPMSGPFAVAGIPSWQSFELQRDRINDAGGITVDGKQYLIELILEDDKLDPETAIAAVTKLIFQDEVDYILTGLSTDATYAYANILIENEVIGITTSPAYIVEEDNKWFFNLVDNDFLRLAAMMAYLSSEYEDIKDIVCVIPDTISGQLNMEMVNAVFPNSWSISDKIMYTAGTVEFSSSAARLVRDNPSAVFFAGGLYGEFALILKGARELGYQGPFIYSTVIDDKVLTDIAGKENSTNIYTLLYNFEATPDLKSLNDAYKEKYGAYSFLTPFQADALPVLLQAIEQAGTTDKYKVRDMLETGEFTSLHGPGAKFVSTDAYGDINHQWSRPIFLGKWENGTQSIIGLVTPDDMLALVE